jgi:phosphate transport system substrate-binding protein
VILALLVGGVVVLANLNTTSNANRTFSGNSTPPATITSTNSASISTPTLAAAGPTCADGTITFDGSTALYPLAKAVGELYQDKCSGATITTKQSGSGAGLQATSDGTVQIGNSDIFADATRFPGLVDHQVAVVVFSVVINRGVTGVTDLTSQQLIDIYTGTTTNWKDVGGPDKQIVTVSRKAGSGMRATFDQYVLGGKEEAGGSNNVVADQSSDLAKTVQGTDGAIGYIGTFYAKQNGLLTIKIDGVSDEDANVKNNSYKFWNLEHMYTKGEATGVAKAFIDYVSGSSSDVQDAFKKNGFLALSYLDPAAKDAKQPKK